MIIDSSPPPFVFLCVRWEYSWDIMEPVTYFTTTFHAMVLVYGWSVLTRKDLLYPVAADHFYLKWLYKLSGKNKFDMER